eukprot:gene22440-29553_t
MHLVPEYTNLDSSYEQPAAVADRFSQLRDAFTKRFGDAPELISRAPGRVNLIGEHIDYEGYGVLPMAIKQDTVVAIRKGGTKLTISNMSDEYPVVEYDTDPKQEVDLSNRTWATYFLCAYKASGVFEMLDARKETAPDPVGLQIMVHGIVPTGSGLSSSAAIVCSCMLALVGSYGLSADRAEVAEWAAKAENYVGVASGGMDQAISMMAMMGVAMLVDFNPVRATDVVLPAGCTFVLANSMATSEKAAGAHKRFNMRVVECRLAAAMLAVALGATKEKAVEIKTLKDVEPFVTEKFGAGNVLAHAANAVREHLHSGLYTHEEIETSLGASLEKIFADSAMALKVVSYAKEVGGFKLHDRAQHVYEEAGRVHTFKGVCDSESETPESKLALVGALMEASHASCDKLYECSCPELNQLVVAAKAAGALGARLTDVDSFMTKVKATYYDAMIKAHEQLLMAHPSASRLLVQRAVSTNELEIEFSLVVNGGGYKPLLDMDGRVKEDALGEIMFASKPASGAAILRI